MLCNEDSAYYQLIRNMVGRVDHETLKSFGINVGYNSWTCGADELRNRQSQLGVQIPWTVIFTDKKTNGPVLDTGRIEALISQGMDLGIYTYLFLCGETISVNEAAYLSSGHPDCGFVFFLPPGALSTEDAQAISHCRNALFCIPADSGCTRSAKLLADHRCLFGVYAFYRDDTVPELLSAYRDSCFLDTFCTFAFLIAASGCGEESKKAVRSFVYKRRTLQQDPAFWIDLMSDACEVGKIIGGGAEILSLDTAGGLRVIGAEEKTGTYDLTEGCLEDIIKKGMPEAKKNEPMEAEKTMRIPSAEKFSFRHHTVEKKENI